MVIMVTVVGDGAGDSCYDSDVTVMAVVRVVVVRVVIVVDDGGW